MSNDNSGHGYSEGMDMPAEEKAHRELMHEQDKEGYEWQNKLHEILKKALLDADVAPADVNEIAYFMFAPLDEFLIKNPRPVMDSTAKP